MSIDDLLSEKTINQVIKTLQDITTELKTLTKPVKVLMNPEEKRKHELFKKVKELRIETEELIRKVKQSQDRKDLKVIKDITDRVKKIIQDKLEIQQELKSLKI